MDVVDLDLRTDGITSVPHCPPFSSIGKTLMELDVRVSVCLIVCVWLTHLATRGVVSFFSLENAVGIITKRKTDSLSFAEWFQLEMLRELPVGWFIRVVAYSSASCMIPQPRPKVFVCGHRSLLEVVEEAPAAC